MIDEIVWVKLWCRNRNPLVEGLVPIILLTSSMTAEPVGNVQDEYNIMGHSHYVTCIFV